MLTVLSVVATFLGVLSILGPFVLWVSRKLRPVWQMADDWSGEPERRGPGGRLVAPSRPSVMERIATLEEGMGLVKKELHPNSGTSARDALDRLEDMVRDLQREVQENRRQPAIEASEIREAAA